MRPRTMARIYCTSCSDITVHTYNRCIHCGGLHTYWVRPAKTYVKGVLSAGRVKHFRRYR